MNGVQINKENLRRHGQLWDDSLKAFTDDAVDIDPIVNISGYTNLKNAKSFSSDMRIDSVNGSRKEIGNIIYLVSVMEKLDNNAIGSALNLDK